MPHIHTGPGQHDTTVSAYIVRLDQPQTLVLVHMHRKLHKLLQVGGHVELSETPWQAIAHEIAEECGYTLAELKILQPLPKPLDVPNNINHPTPFMLNTHKFADSDHYHSDSAFAFTALLAPSKKPNASESQDLRWLSLSELDAAVLAGHAYADTAIYYRSLVEQVLPKYYALPAEYYSCNK